MRNTKQHAEYTKQWRIKNSAHIKQYAIDNKERRKKNNLKSLLKKKYNITIEEYEKMYAEQKGCCAICGKHRDTHTINLAVDHSHSTNKIRGLLCKRCNLMLGSVCDDISLLEKAIIYLSI